MTEAPESEPGSALTDASRLSFNPLTIVPEGDEYLVGDPAREIFLSLPEVGAIAVRALAAGATIEEATKAASDFAGEHVNVLEFAQGLLEAGLALGVAGEPDVPVPLAPAAPSRLERVPLELVGPLFSPLAWTFYGLTAVGATVGFVVWPAFWPTFEDVFFVPNPAVCIVTVFATTVALAGAHEFWHWLAARAEGVAARFSVGRRLFFPVFETDLSQLWSVPRRRRYGPFLAGMALNSTLLAGSLGVRVAWSEGWFDPPPLLVRYLGVLVLLNLLGIGFQLLVFLRTDLYAVLITLLGCRNLYRVNFLFLKSKLVGLRPTEASEIEQAHPRDLQVARWFGLLYVIGLAWSAWYFVRIFFPGTVIMAGWMFHSLTGAPLGSSAFWEPLAIGLVAATQFLWPLTVFAVELIRRRRGVA